jgi:Uma2 family endonuclease
MDMARVPLTKEKVETDRVILNVEKVALSEEQFFRLCSDNPDLRFELTAQKELIIMPPAFPQTGWRNNRICYRLTQWADEDGTGYVFDSSAGYTLPNGATRGPDASWIRRDHWKALGDEAEEEKKERFAHICPDFVVELMSISDRLKEQQAKMVEYIANGARLGWLIDPFDERVYIYRPDRPVECVENPAHVSGDPVLPGFVFNASEIFGNVR